ncbi:MAG: MBL fold metallo-hydrolase [Actinobacteria bacterium]|nr:MBL fold metallo-hydrolase [Actinomycetota bacterium]
MKLTIIVDNYVDSMKLKAEHGWSILIEDENRNILLDCGQSNLLLDNAKILGVDLTRIDSIVLSHGHYDHTGGLMPLLKNLNKKIDVYVHPAAFEEKFSRYKGFNGFNENRYIGIPEKKHIYEKNGASFIESKDFLKLSENIFFSGQINDSAPIPKNGDALTKNSFFIKKDGTFIKDMLYDDISVFIKLPKLLLIVTGCAHSGIINIIKKAQDLNLIDEEIAIIGGLHLSSVQKHDIDIVIEELKKFRIRLLVPAHCTGIEAFVHLKNAFGSNCVFSRTGKVINI